MKTRQFKQLANISSSRRDALIIEGLTAISCSINTIVSELESCEKAGTPRAGRLLRNVGFEEAGKFLILLDLYRCPNADQQATVAQLGRAGNHLAKHTLCTNG
jgi:hypothetical protein